MNYKDAGVDVEKGNAFVEEIKKLVPRSGIGGFNSFYKLPENIKNPVLVSATDGVGTKVKLAAAFNMHDKIGDDLVAMCVNDILTCGAEPLYFLDYFAVAELNEERDKRILHSIIDACNFAGCPLVGGETAEMPDVYDRNGYDLAGFVTGIVSQDDIIDGSRIKSGDVIVGVESNGVHANGFSLIRKIMPDRIYEDDYIALREELMKATYIYSKLVKDIKSKFTINGMAHITGGGLEENLARVIKKDFSIDWLAWPRHIIFSLIKGWGPILEKEMRKVFNCGIGYCFIVSPRDADAVVDEIKYNGYYSSKIGVVK